MSAEERYHSFARRYENGEVIPWDDPLPPPEVAALAQRLSAGRALDLGSGYGRTAIYLAQRGWRVTGVEYVPAATREAARRAAAAGVSARAYFAVGDVSRLTFLTGPFDLAVDVGCMHSLSAGELSGYRDGLARLLAPGAHFLLFAHLRDPAGPEPQRWIGEEELRALFARDFLLEDSVLGSTQVADREPWPSGWFTYRRAAGSQT